MYMSQVIIKIETIQRLEKITGQHIIRGGDKIINIALDIMQEKIQKMETNHACKSM